MGLIIPKGTEYSAMYTVTDMDSATDWTGSVKLYTTYPGTPLLSKELVYNQAENNLGLVIDLDDLSAIAAGMYEMVATIASVTAGVNVNKLDYVTILAAGSLTSAPMTVIKMTILKLDGTPSGREVRTLINGLDGASVQLAWEGISVTASHPVADEVSGVIVGIEIINAKTNAAGYAQLAVIKGQTVTVSCPAFGKSITVDTTGFDEIDLSSYF